MKKKVFTLIKSADDFLNRVQLSVKAVLDDFSTDTLLNRSIVTTGVLTTDTVVAHNLGRLPQGFIVVGLDSGATIYEPSSVSRNAQTITLRATVAVNATIIFF